MSQTTSPCNRTSKALTAEQILRDAVEIDDLCILRNHLRELADHYLLYTEDNPDDRQNIYASFMVLDTHLQRLQDYKFNLIAEERREK